MNRLRTLRLARGLSLDQLAAQLGGIVTKQALSKYETGDMSPSPGVATVIAKFFEISAAELWSKPQTEIQRLAYRATRELGEKHRDQIEAIVVREFQRRIDLQERCLGVLRIDDVPILAFEVSREEDAEAAAMQLRMMWDLGLDPIPDMIALLEEHMIHVIELDSVDGFDGLSAIAKRQDQGRVAVAVVCRDDCPGDRQRFSLAHELGHIVMKTKAGLDDEVLANRFAGAFLLPASILQRELGVTRTNINMAELVVLKRYCKVSIQSLVVRSYQLSIISAPTYRSCFTYINRMGWKTNEPEAIPREKSEWVERVVLRGLAEGILSKTEARSFVGDKVPLESESGILRRRQFLALSPEEQKALLEQQAERFAEYYGSSEWDVLETEGLDAPQK